MEIIVFVIPNSKKLSIQKLWKDLVSNRQTYRVKLTTKPINNQANKQLIEFLADYFDVKKRSIKIIKWKESKQKIIKIEK